MPELPEGERELQDVALQFARAEGYVLGLFAMAAAGELGPSTKLALERLAALRLLDFRTPVITAYMAEHPWFGDPAAVDDLAGSLAKRLDQGAKTAADGVRDSFRKVTAGNLQELLSSPLTAAVDARGTTGPSEPGPP